MENTYKQRVCTLKRMFSGNSVFYHKLTAISIQKDPSNPKLFTNRAMAHLKLEAWESCIDDCIKSIELENDNMKGYYYLAQAQLGLKHPSEALSSALTAYEICVSSLSSSTSAVSALVLKAKKEKWAAKEQEKARRTNLLLKELEETLLENKDKELGNLQELMLSENEEAEQREEVEAAARRKIDDLRTVFAIADPKNLTRRVHSKQYPLCHACSTNWQHRKFLNTSLMILLLPSCMILS